MTITRAKVCALVLKLSVRRTSIKALMQVAVMTDQHQLRRQQSRPPGDFFNLSALMFQQGHQSQFRMWSILAVSAAAAWHLLIAQWSMIAEWLIGQRRSTLLDTRSFSGFRNASATPYSPDKRWTGRLNIQSLRQWFSAAQHQYQSYA